MEITLRAAEARDAEACGRICYEAFKTLAERHGFAPDFPTAEAASGLLAQFIAHPGFYGVVAEAGGRVLGSNFLDERGPIAGVGPLTIDPRAQDKSLGRRLMAAVLARGTERGAPGLRLCQAAYHNRSLGLYTKLGFETREPLSTLQGTPPAVAVAGCTVRAMTDSDLDACNELCRSVHGHARGGELADALARGDARVVERGGRIAGYATGIGFLAHAVGASNDDVKALIAAAPAIEGPGVLVPTRNAELLGWCLEHGLRLVQQMTLMSRGLYNEPRGAWLPSVLY